MKKIQTRLKKGNKKKTKTDILHNDADFENFLKETMVNGEELNEKDEEIENLMVKKLGRYKNSRKHVSSVVSG